MAYCVTLVWACAFRTYCTVRMNQCSGPCLHRPRNTSPSVAGRFVALERWLLRRLPVLNCTLAFLHVELNMYL